MSPAGKVTILVATFVLGFAAAWTTKPSAPPASTAAGTSSPEPPGGTKPIRPSKDEPKRKVAGLLKSLDDAGYDPDKIDGILAGMSGDDFSDLIQEYSRRAGVTGLGEEDLQSIGKLVSAWHAKDPNAALQWALSLSKPNDRKQFLSLLIGDIAKKDLNAALVLVQEHGKNEEGGWDVPFEFMRELGKHDSHTMVRALGTFISTDGSSTGFRIEFASDFDFRAAMDGLAAVQAGLGPDDLLASVPSNMLAEWARRDGTAAWAWLQESKQVPHSDVNEFFDGYALVATPDELTSRIVEAMTGELSFDQKFKLACDALSERPNAAAISLFLERAPMDRNDALPLLFRTSSRASGGNYDEFNQLLFQQMSAAERSAVLCDEFKNGATPLQKSFYTPLLRQLGHSDEEIRQMLPPDRK